MTKTKHIGWIKQDWIDMPPKSNIFIKRRFKHLNLYREPCGCYKHTIFKKVCVTVEVLK